MIFLSFAFTRGQAIHELPGSGLFVTIAYSSFDDWENETRRTRRIMEDTINRRSVLTGSFARDFSTCVSVAIESREVRGDWISRKIVLLTARSLLAYRSSWASSTTI